jgi:hypothetical protein
MKPKTKIEKEVHALMRELPPLTPEQMTYAKGKLFKSNLYKTNQHTTCLDCSHKWDTAKEPKLSAVLLGDVCPNCGAKLNPLATLRKRTNKQSAYIGMATIKGGYQVFRFWYVSKTVKVGFEADYYFMEVAQQWINEKGKLIPVGAKYNPMGYGYGERWIWGSELEIRQNPDKYYIYTKQYFPNKKLLPVVRRNGYKNTFHTLQAGYFCELVLSNQKAETLLKTGQIPLFGAFYNQERNIERYWPSIKIAIRHHYTIPHHSDWFDHLNELRYLGMDILNPKNICIEDFQTEHQRIVDRANRVRAKRRYEQEKKNLEQAEINYARTKEPFFNLAFKKGDLSIEPLKSVAEFYEEGEIMHHCVTRYHSEPSSLILSAKKNGQRVETVQVNLKDFRVGQSRGLQNTQTKHHNEIVALVEGNMNKIKKAAKTKKA